MKVKQLREVLASSAQLYRAAGDHDTAAALKTFDELLSGHETKTVAVLSKLIAKAGVSSAANGRD